MRMRHLCGVVVAASLVLGASPAPGDGSAVAAEVTVTLRDAPAVRVGPLALASTSGTTNADIAGVNASGLVMAGMATSYATRDEDTGDVHAQADVNDVDIRLPALTGTFGSVIATCEATQTGAKGVSMLGNGRIAGLLVGANPAPNTTVDLAAAKVVFNEQIQQADGSLTVNAVHIYLKARIGAGHVVLAKATCGLAAHPVPLATGPGLWLGLGLVALVAGALLIRRQTRITRIPR
ncbi:choice-of-anchor P family protein [Actinophytocola sp.]|uniref:choice-of-anchor P family protein n=1 Tax=Actinophytocola sp. TaxID=1872138 RepID=UPI002ED63AD0